MVVDRAGCGGTGGVSQERNWGGARCVENRAMELVRPVLYSAPMYLYPCIVKWLIRRFLVR